jgi:hypothetical protein
VPNACLEYRKGEFTISTDRELLGLHVVHGFLTQCYWAKGIPRDVVVRSIENSLCFGVYAERKQIGFAHVISDYATYAYIGDVFVLESFRRCGLGKMADGVCHAAPASAGIAPLELGHPGRSRAILKTWVRASEEASGLHGASSDGCL